MQSSTQNVLLFLCPYLPIGKYGQKATAKYPYPAKTLIKQRFFSLQKKSKKCQTNGYALADKHCHTSEFCPVNIKQQCYEHYNS